MPTSTIHHATIKVIRHFTQRLFTIILQYKTPLCPSHRTTSIIIILSSPQNVADWYRTLSRTAAADLVGVLRTDSHYHHVCFVQSDDGRMTGKEWLRSFSQLNKIARFPSCVSWIFHGLRLPSSNQRILLEESKGWRGSRLTRYCLCLRCLA